MKKTILITLFAICMVASAYAVDDWCIGHAMNSRGTKYLNGWTIKCNEGTNGSSVAAPTTASFALSYTLRPAAGYYYLTADSGLALRVYSPEFYYSGTGLIDLGTINFVPVN